MAIDHIVELDCPPKRALSAGGILERIKERARAREVIRWFRAAGDRREPAKMGFEFSQRRPGAGDERQLIVVQDLLDHAAALDEQEAHCSGCPANLSDSAFGCIGAIQYPLSASAETWLLERLPLPDEPLVWLLLRQGIRNLGYDGSSIKALRVADGASEAGARSYFELPYAPQRRLGEVVVTSDQALEMIFGVGERIMPNHAGILLLFFNAINRDLEAAEIQSISSMQAAQREAYPFLMSQAAAPDSCVREFIAFFKALHRAWQLNLPLFIDS